MKNGDEDSYAPLERAIGYCFKERKLLEEALTHRSRTHEASSAGRDNQRFEFFGDAILEFLVSRELFLRFPALREGELSRMRATLVDESNLYQLALTVNLGAFLRLGKGEEKCGGRNKKSLLADAFEALVAAVYLDGGLQPVQRLVKRHFGSFFENMAGAAVARDYKTELQELAQARFGAAPRYELIDAVGPDHAREYRVAVLLNGAVAGTGSGRSKKVAEQAAAAEAIGFFSA